MGSCQETVMCSNVAGERHHEIERLMGAYPIKATTVLRITREGEGKYSYVYKSTISDSYSDKSPFDEDFRGTLSSEVVNNSWKLLQGELEDRGAYIVVPEDNWNGYFPEKIEMRFFPGRGDSMIFERKN